METIIYENMLTRFLLRDGVKYVQEMRILEEKKDRIIIDPVIRAPYDEACKELWRTKSARRLTEYNAIHYIEKDRVGKLTQYSSQQSPACEVILHGGAEETAQQAEDMICQFCGECLEEADREYDEYRNAVYRAINAAYAPSFKGARRNTLHVLSRINTLAKQMLRSAPDENDCSSGETEVYAVLAEFVHLYPEAVHELNR